MERTEDQLKQQRAAYKGQLTAFKTWLKSVDAQKTTRNFVDLKVQQLAKTFSNYDEVQFCLELKDPSQNKDRIEFENNYQKTLCDVENLITKLKALEPPPPTSPQLNRSVSSQGGADENVSAPTRLVLPQISIQKFSGDVQSWPAFKEIFTSLIENNESIPLVQKHHYLRSFLEGQAARLLDAIPITAESYATAIQLLASKYEQPKVALKKHVKALFELEPVRYENPKHLEKLLDLARQNVNSLEGRGMPVKHWDLLLVELMISKIDSTTVRSWEMETSGELNPSFKSLCAFLQKRINILYAINKASDRKSPPVKGKQFPHSKAFTVTNDDKSKNYQRMKCDLCVDMHPIYQCRKYNLLSVDERRKTIQELKRCFNCLARSHIFSKCPSEKRCMKCSGKHHTSLHRNETSGKFENKTEFPYSSNVNSQDTQQAQSYFHNSGGRRGTQVLLSTCFVQVKTQSGKWIKTRALLDSAATHDFATTRLVKQLNIPYSETQVNVIGIGQKETNATNFAKLLLKDSVTGSFFMKLNCLVIDNISSEIPAASFSVRNWNIPDELNLADIRFNETGPVDLLLSASSFWRVFLGGKVKVAPGVFARNTRLGWVLTGKMYCSEIVSKQHCMFTDVRLQSQIESFWQQEEINNDTQNSLSSEEEYCETLFKSTTSRNEEGRFIVRMPLKDNQLPVVNSKKQVMKLFHCTESKLSKDDGLRNQYTNFMEEYEALGHMTVCKYNAETPNAEVFLSHHPVWKNTETRENIRVVFNASLKDKEGKSLNDFLCTGPKLQSHLCDILLNFRLNEIAVVGDLSKMYRCILIHPDERPLQKIFWRPSHKQALKTFELQTLTYGVKSSSFLAIRTLKELALQDGHLYHESAAHSLLEHFYIDDYLESFLTIEEAQTTVNNLTMLLKGGGFPLTKICSNSLEFLQYIPEPERHLQISEIERGDKTIKTLGIYWNPFTDSFHYEYKPKSERKLTKRKILSAIVSIFDPINLIAPIVVVAKMFMQKLWLMKCPWDDIVPKNFQTEWTQFERDLKDLSWIVIPRQICSQAALLEPDLHIFCDASLKAFGCCAYIVNKNESSLICAKSKVAPLKVITLPRLELCAALLAVKLKNHIVETLKIKIKNIYFWTDAKIILAWITQPHTKWVTFVANRVQQIQKGSLPEQWQYVPSEQNPSDLVSRGCQPKKLVDNILYWNGPKWLIQDECQWPKTGPIAMNTIPEEKRVVKVSLVTEKHEQYYERFSNLNTLVKVTAYILRWKKKVLDKLVCDSEQLSTEEIVDATNKLIILAQRHHFSNEYSTLKVGCTLDKRSSLYSLNPFVDDKGIIRVGGRLAQSHYTYDKKFPIVLPYKEHIAYLIIKGLHLKHLHVGSRALLYIVRENYWPIKALHTIKAIIKECLACYRIKPQTATQLMGNLPDARTQPQRVFNTVGIDYTGSFLLKNPSVKAYVILFICLTVGAVHLELVSNSNSAYFLEALERFVSRRGIPSHVFSDNAPNLTKVQKIFNAQLQKRQRNVLNKFCGDNHIQWHHLPPYAPSMGGRWESQMKILKKHIKASIGNTSLPYEHFNSLLIRIEGIMNSRPIGPVSSDPQDILPLTPSHFISGRSLTSLPSSSSCLKEMNLMANLKLIKAQELQFWSRWKKEYLSNLQQRNKWKISAPNLKIGDLVLLKDASPPLMWNLGRVVTLYKGKDSKCRVIDVLTKRGIQKRHLSRICPLPMVNEDIQDV